jgi:hypothetical protein
LSVTAEPIHPDQLNGQARFRVDLVAHLDSLRGRAGRAAGGVACSRQEPLGLGVLMVALNHG